MKTFKEIQRIGLDRQNGRVRDVIVDRKPGAPEGSDDRIYVENFGECFAMSCQPAGRHQWKLTVRRA